LSVESQDKKEEYYTIMESVGYNDQQQRNTLAGNMKIDGHKGDKMVMQVNKYIPHYQRIPTKLDKKDLKMFQEDYTKNEQLAKIQDHLINFDHVLLECLMGDR
jgi:hypothetical protein